MAKNIEINIKGSDGNYEVLYPKVSSSTSVISSDVATNFGLDSGSSIDDVLKYIGKYNLHWWKRRKFTYKENKTDVTSLIYLEQDTGNTIKYSKEIEINQFSGEITLKNPIDFNIGMYDNRADLESTLNTLIELAPVYLTNLYSDSSTTVKRIFYLPENSDVALTAGTSTMTAGTICLHWSKRTSNEVYFGVKTSVTAKQITSKFKQESLTENVYSINSSAYPFYGLQEDGYEYSYLGIPYQQMSQNPNGVLINTFQINLTSFGSGQLFKPQDLALFNNYLFEVSYDIVLDNLYSNSIQVKLGISTDSGNRWYDTTKGSLAKFSYAANKSSISNTGNSRAMYLNTNGGQFFNIYTDTAVYSMNFYNASVYLNFLGPNLTTDQLNQISVKRANFTVKVYKQVLC